MSAAGTSVAKKAGMSIGAGMFGVGAEVANLGWFAGGAMDAPGELGWAPGVFTAAAAFAVGLPAAMSGSIGLAFAIPTLAMVGAGMVSNGIYNTGMRKYNDLIARTTPGMRMHSALTQGAVTMRQASMSALQNSPYNVRRVYGREAELLHS